jgi:hypothetical protein
VKQIIKDNIELRDELYSMILAKMQNKSEDSSQE